MQKVLFGMVLLSTVAAISQSPLATTLSAAGPKCSNIPLRVTLLSNVMDPVTAAVLPSAITADAGGEYVDGLSSVSAEIKICAGTYDVVLQSSQRPFVYRFPAPIPGSLQTGFPSWVPAPGSAGLINILASGLINIRNILCVGCADAHQPFTTHAAATLNLPDRTSYRLAFVGDPVIAPDLHLNPIDSFANTNQPFSSSVATVYPQSFNCQSGGTTRPSWLVVGNNPNAPVGSNGIQVGTLEKLASRPHEDPLHQGQYSMPFELRIDALKCFTY